MKRFLIFICALILTIFVGALYQYKTFQPAPAPVPEQTITVTPPAEVNIKSEKPVDVKIKVAPPELPGKIEGDAITVTNVFNAINQERYNAHLGLLKLDPNLTAGAEAKLADMLANNYFAHESPDGKHITSFVKNFGGLVGENLAVNFYTVQDLVSAWINSPTHKAILLSTGYNRTGIAIENGCSNLGCNIVVQVFGNE